jgi:hypothetical protein
VEVRVVSNWVQAPIYTYGIIVYLSMLKNNWFAVFLRLSARQH